MCNFITPNCSTCHKPVNIGSITSCGLIPAGMAVWFCPEMTLRSVDVVGGCYNCSHKEKESFGGSMGSAETLVGECMLESRGDSGQREDWKMVKQEDGIGSRKSSMDTKVNEEEDSIEMMKKESPRTSRETPDDEPDIGRQTFGRAAVDCMKDMVTVNGYLINEKSENKRHEMIEEEKKRWSRQRRGHCVIQ